MTRQRFSSAITPAFIDLATYSDRERNLYGGNDFENQYRTIVSTTDLTTQIPVELYVNDDLDFKFEFGKEYIFKPTRIADYYTSMWLEINITNVSSDIIWTENLFHNIIENLEFGTITGSCYQRFTPEVLDAYAAFTRDSKYFKMINPSSNDGAIRMVLPIPIFFSRTTHDAFPITMTPFLPHILRIKISALDNLIISEDVKKLPLLDNFRVYLNGVVVNGVHRKEMMSPSNKFIEGTIISTHPLIADRPNLIQLNFDNKSIKAFFFMVRDTSNPTKYIELQNNVKLLYDNTTRLDQPPYYYSYIQPDQQPSCIIPSAPGYYMYSYATDCMAIKPTGSTNYSKISGELVINDLFPTDTFEVVIIGITIDCLRIADGYCQIL
jgi:hypothetical protein